MIYVCALSIFDPYKAQEKRDMRKQQKQKYDEIG